MDGDNDENEVVEFLKKLPIIGGLMEAGDVVGVLKNMLRLMIETFKIFKNLLTLMLESFNLGREMVNWFISMFKLSIDVFLDSMDLLNSLIELLKFGGDMFTKYLKIPITYIYLIPIFTSIELLIQFVSILTFN